MELGMLQPRLAHFIIFLSALFFFTEASPIPLGSKLFVKRHDCWISSNGNFSFGFFNCSDQPNRYCVGIRFSSISIPSNEQKMVWVAGVDVSVGYDSFLYLTAADGLVLFDSTKRAVVWSSNTLNSSVAFAGLRDDGNLVLLNQEQDIVWQSFETPSDTLLPGQNLTSLQTLRAASHSFVSSYYSLSMNSLGQLRLSWETNVTYWKAEATSSLPIAVAIFTKEGAFQLLDTRSRPVWSRFGDDHNDSKVRFRFLRLDRDGNLRMYSWAEASKSWTQVWQAVENQCHVFATCSSPRICSFNLTQSMACKCPYMSGNESNSNCLAPYSQECSSGSTMIALKDTFLYGIYPPEDSKTQCSVEQCKISCLQDPNCTSVTVRNDGTAICLTKKTRFITGYEDPSSRSMSFVKVCADPVAAFPGNVPPPPSAPSVLKRSHGSYTSFALWLASGALIFFLVIQIGVFLYLLKRKRTVEKLRAAYYPFQNSFGLISLSYSELKDITGNFRDQLGSNVYKGVLPTNQVVVVKELKHVAGSGETMDDREFRFCISVLGGVHHKNLVKLEGYCCDSGQRFLVYEFHKNASVDKWIEEANLSKRLSWKRRIEICIGVARAIAYLHSGCRQFFSHGNLKWENVLLNEELEAKVTDFSLLTVSGKTSQNSPGAEADVARFGQMVVEILSGHRGRPDVCGWAYKEWLEGHAMRVVDSRIGLKFNMEEVERSLRIAFWCVQTDAQLRPSMVEVMKVLEGKQSVDPPPPPPPDSCLMPLAELQLT